MISIIDENFCYKVGLFDCFNVVRHSEKNIYRWYSYYIVEVGKEKCE